MRNPNMHHLLEHFSCFLLLVSVIHVVLSANYDPTDKIFLNCGANVETSDDDGRKWISDVGSNYTLSGRSSIASAAIQKPSVPTIPYMTARLFESEFTYSFPVSSGRKFVRLYFYPAAYANLLAKDGVFSVNVGPYTLLKNFSAYETANNLNYDFFFKEYSVNMDSGTLNVTFIPAPDHPNSYAFINGIEIVSHPDIYSSKGTSMLGTSTSFDIDNATALENVYRLNVGGQAISPNGDTGLFRQWDGDVAYIYGSAIGVSVATDPNLTISYPSGIPDYVAPVDVYKTARAMGPTPQINLGFNLSWYFDVDTGFSYLVRLHFCEIDPDITKINQRVFKIFINNQTAQADADVVAWALKSKVPIFKDYVVFLPVGSPRQNLWLALHPNTELKPYHYDAILNGVEIFKVNVSDGNLAGSLPNPIPNQSVIDPSRVLAPKSGKSNNKGGIIGGSIGGVLVGIVLVGVLVYFLSCKGKRRKNQNQSDRTSNWLPLSLYGNSHSSITTAKTYESYAPSIPTKSNLGRHFTFAEIQAATNNFDEARLLGVGGFGKVYKGEIDGGATKLAIKRGDALSDQGVNEFRTELEMLSKLRHRHLVSLIGYCEENTEMILVYDYMAHGTLREHLYKTQNQPLTWKQRLDICIGAARGLHYLHTGAKHTIIHRDVKTTNILLDEKFVAKVSDFGLSKTGPTMDHTHVSTIVKGSFGYLDPEYYRRQKLTEKSDVYSFGVVLFEILSGRPALNPTLAKEQVSLAEWALHCHKKGILDELLDPYLRGKVSPECFKKVAEIAVKCLADEGIHRPSMGDILWNLEFALQLQESGSEEPVDMESDDLPLNGRSKDFDVNGTDSTSNWLSTSIRDRSLASEDSSGLTPSVVFSQIMNPNGR
ncbi:hypothetical protein R6Q59_018383 [Mikania micrantha]